MSKSLQKGFGSSVGHLLKPAKWVLAGIMGIAMGAGVGLANAASIDFNPADTLVTIGDPIPSIDLLGSAFNSGSNGGGVKVTWDPAIVQLSAVTADPIWDVDVISAIDNVLGEVTINVTNIFAPTATEAFSIASLDFLTASVGTSALGLQIASQWYDGTGAMVTPSLGLGSIQVQAVPVPAAVWLFGSGILGLVGIARRKQA